LNLLILILFGIIQGLTEFFPVSSSGHLVLFQNLFGFEEPQIFVYAMLHFGTLLSLLVFLRRDLHSLILSAVKAVRHPRQALRDPGFKLIVMLSAASIPTFLIGYFFSNFFESLFESLSSVGIALLGTSAFLFWTKRPRDRKPPLLWHALIIGLLQGAAIVPGFSRSGLTIGGALLLGWDKSYSARFSFLLSIPAILGAALYQLHRIDLGFQSWPALAAGTLIAALVGYAALRYLTSLTIRGHFYIFAYYCAAAGIVALVLS